MASQSSSTSSTSPHQDANKQNQHPNSNSNNLEFVELSKDDSVHGSKVKEYNFLSPIQVGSSSCFPNNNDKGKDESNNEEKNSDSTKSYSCSYCNGRYSSLQALGGHQNAHREERALQKRLINQRYAGDDFNLGQPRNPYLNYPITPFSPYNNYRPLGVRIESMIQKSPYISPRVGGLGALPLHDILNPSLLSMRNNIEGSNGGIASLGILRIGGASTSRTADEFGTNNRNGAILRIGESSTNIMAPTSTMNGIHNIEEETSESESSGLDLSLKL